MIKAYVLTNSNSPGSIPSLTELLSKVWSIKGVKQAHAITGPHGGIAYIEVKDNEELLETVGELLDLEGIDSTDTRIAFPR